MAEKLRFGMIGLGEIAFRSTGWLLQDTANCEMVVGMDPVEDIARSYQERFEIPCSTDLDDVLNHPDVDAVVVSTPTTISQFAVSWRSQPVDLKAISPRPIIPSCSFFATCASLARCTCVLVEFGDVVCQHCIRVFGVDDLDRKVAWEAIRSQQVERKLIVDCRTVI